MGKILSLVAAFLAHQERAARFAPRGVRARQGGWASYVAAGAAALTAINGATSGHGGGGQASSSQQQQDAMSRELFDFHRANYQPLEMQAIHDASVAGSPEMQEQRAAQAGTTVNTAYDNATKSLAMQRNSMGIRPDSGATMDMDRQNAIARAGGVAGAENTARQDERVYGLNARTQVAGLGRNLPATALTGEAGAANASAIAAQNALRNQQYQTNQNSAIGSAAGAVSSAVRGLNSSPPVGSPTSSATIDTPVDYGAYFRKGGLIRPPSRTHGYKKGGAVRGPGTGTSDSIPVDIAGKPGAIANGEYVLNAKATKRIGLKRLDRMNLTGLPKGSKMKNGTHIEPVKKMADGGVTDDDVPRITITPKSGGKPMTEDETKQMNKAPAQAPKPADRVVPTPHFTTDQIPNARGAIRPDKIAMKDGGAVDDDVPAERALKGDEKTLKQVGENLGRVKRDEYWDNVAENMRTQKATNARVEEFATAEMRKRPLKLLKYAKGGAVKLDGDDESDDDGDDTDSLEKDLQYARGGKILVKPGAFHRWLGKPQGAPITQADIQRGLAAGGHPAKMANFARNFAH